MTLAIETVGKKLSFTVDKVGVAPFESPCKSMGWEKKVARELKLPADFVVEAVKRHRDYGELSFEHEGDKPTKSVFTVRKLSEKSATGKQFDTFDEALRYSCKLSESIVAWEHKSDVAVLDIDWHKEEPGPGSLDVLSHCIMRPSYAWVSKSGGLHLVFEKKDNVPADVLAVVTAYKLLPHLYGHSGIDIISNTRRPAKWKDVDTDTTLIDLGSLRDMFTNREIPVEERDEWLEARRLVMGQRYDHDHCQIDSSHKSKAVNPVVIMESGVFCHSCKARIGYGLKTWGAILHAELVPSQLGTCIKSFTHYEHAKYVLESAINIPAKLRESFYRAALTLVHGVDEKRVERVFAKRDLLRYSGYWATREGSQRRPALCIAAISRLPCAITSDGTPDAEIVERFQDSAPLDAWGYVALKPIHGARFATRLLEPKDGSPRVEKYHYTIKTRPTYLAPADRLEESAAWEILEKVYRNADRALIEMLAFCRGHVELGIPLNCPIFMLEGASGAGKTGSPHLAAAILGDFATRPKASTNDDTMGRQILLSMASGTFIIVDEVVKAAEKNGMSVRSSLDYLLNLSPYTTARRLYENEVMFGELPVLIISDIGFSSEVLEDAQLGRRIFHKHLGTRNIKWKEAAAAAGLGDDIFNIRHHDDMRLAADSLFSIWGDRYFSDASSILTPDAVAELLGIKRLDSLGHAAKRIEKMKALFAAWVADDTNHKDWVKKLINPGYKAFNIEASTPLAIAWRDGADENEPTKWGRGNDLPWEDHVGRLLPMKLEQERLRSDRGKWVQIRFSEQREGDVWETILS